MGLAFAPHRPSVLLMTMRFVGECAENNLLYSLTRKLLRLKFSCCNLQDSFQTFLVFKNYYDEPLGRCEEGILFLLNVS